MAHIIIRHRVMDFPEWKRAFDRHDKVRRQAGQTSCQVFYEQEDENHVFILLGWDDMDRAREFIASSDLAEEMRRAGVAEAPDVYFLERAGGG